MNWVRKLSPVARGVAVSLLAISAACLFRAVFFSDLDRGIPYLIFFPAVTLAALFGGLTAGIVSTVLSAALSYFWIQQGHKSPVESLALLIFVVSGMLISFVCERLRRANTQATKALAQAETKNQELHAEVVERERAVSKATQLAVALQESEQRLNEAQAMASLGSYVLDIATGSWRSSSALDKLFGIGPTYERSVAGWQKLLHPDDRTMMSDYLTHEVIGRGQTFNWEYRIVRQDTQAVRWVLGLGKLELDSAGKPQLMQGTVQDITERKQTEQALRASEIRYRRLFETTKDGILMLDAATGMVLEVNPFLIELLSFTREDFLGKKVWELGFFRDLVACQDNFAELQAKEYIRYDDMALQTRDGRRIEVEFTSSVYLVNRQKVIQCNIRDISIRKQAKTEILLLNQTLEQRVRDRTAELESANRELEAFSYSVSHDLRAPLRSIDGFSRILLEDHAEAVGVEGRDSLDRIRAASQRMALLIDDLLDLSRIGRVEMKRETVDLTALARSVAAELMAEAPGRTVDWVVADGLIAHGDSRLLRIVLRNLLGNAWKFTGRRERARIEFGATEQGGEPTYFVRDDGAGFDPAYAGKLFGAFQRLHTTDEFPGTGIGLTTVQRIVRRHGGSIHAEAAVGQGATFSFTVGARA